MDKVAFLVKPENLIRSTIGAQQLFTIRIGGILFKIRISRPVGHGRILTGHGLVLLKLRTLASDARLTIRLLRL